MEYTTNLPRGRIDTLTVLDKFYEWKHCTAIETVPIREITINNKNKTVIVKIDGIISWELELNILK